MTGRARLGRTIGGSLLALATMLVVPAAALGHPLGNFTINHFAAIRVAPESISLDVVIDRAEIPAFQEQQRLDVDGNGSLSAVELTGQAAAGCQGLASNLRLSVGESAIVPTLIAAGV